MFNYFKGVALGLDSYKLMTLTNLGRWFFWQCVSNSLSCLGEKLHTPRAATLSVRDLTGLVNKQDHV